MVSGVPRRRWGYEALRLGTNGLPVDLVGAVYRPL